MNAYASDKILAHLPIIQQLRDGQQPAPRHVQLVISDLCNQNCSWCTYRSDGYESNQLFKIIESNGRTNNNPNRMIAKDKAFEILNDAESMGCKAVLFTGGGEPTVHPHHEQIIRHTKDLGLDYALITNGTRISDSLRELLTDATWVRVSVDAGTPDSYSSIRQSSPATYERVWQNIELLAQAKKQRQGKVYLGVGFVVSRESWSEVVLAAKRAKDSGADSFRISGAFTTERGTYFDGWGPQAAELCRQAQELSDHTFSVSNMFLDRVDDITQGSPNYKTCHYMQVTTYIGGDLNVYRCCNTAYNERGLVGSLKAQSFRSLWESQAKRDDFSSFDARGCVQCMFNLRNRAMEAVVNPLFSHENFI